MRLAPEGRPFVLGSTAVLVLLAVLDWRWAMLWLPVLVWVAAFFRDPDRTGPRGHELVLAPADGKVVSVREIEEPTFHAGTTSRISIFMNVFNVHVNRYPSSGEIALRDYHAGTFLNAASEKASLDNEQATVGLMTPNGRVLVRQIAGLVARRIVTDHSVGTVVEQGQRMGIIRFGSRVDVFLPTRTRVLVKVGDRTKAGITVVARWT
ncbi:MAG: phosphatidylserine decarboxylase family protein [Gemmatimonadales bacterium]|nr:phosphatidylserine decarboxylase family protein [Gemmatimonadales bacterium]